MPFLIAGVERYALRVGRNVLGGNEPDAVPLASLASSTPAAVITVETDRSASIQRLAASVVVTVDGESVDSAPHALRHGARIAVGPCRLMYADPSAQRSASAEAPTEIAQPLPEGDSGGRLIASSNGQIYPVPTSGLVLGRGGSADISLDEKGISRRHAVVKPDGAGFRVTDESANGTFVNGERIATTRALAHGDVLRLGSTDFRFEVAAALRETSASALCATELVPGVRQPAARVLALLEITGGPLAGTVFRVARPVCSVGRSDSNDVRIADASVSASHATLLLKHGTWYVVDLQSANGTYIDGYRVATERALPDGGMLRIGDVVMRLRVLSDKPRPDDPTQAAVGSFWRRLAKRLNA
jgi:pSer/pThr/pTyr-binding forkhead associated (FHA) protein